MNDDQLIYELKKYKALHFLTNEDIGYIIRMHKTAVSKLLNKLYPISEIYRFRIEELLRNGEENKTVNYKNNQKAPQSHVNKNKPSKISINVKVKNKLVDKIAHVNPPKKRSR